MAAYESEHARVLTKLGGDPALDPSKLGQAIGPRRRHLESAHAAYGRWLAVLAELADVERDIRARDA